MATSAALVRLLSNITFTINGTDTAGENGNSTIGELPGAFFGNVRFPWVFTIWAGLLGAWLLWYSMTVHRVLASLISSLINRLVFRGSAHLSIGSITFALLGGIIALTDVKYVTESQVVKAVSIVIRVNWWLPQHRVQTKFNGRKTATNITNRQQSNAAFDANRAGSPAADAKLDEDARTARKPTRLHVRVAGLQVALLNSKAAYESIAAQNEGNVNLQFDGGATSCRYTAAGLTVTPPHNTEWPTPAPHPFASPLLNGSSPPPHPSPFYRIFPLVHVDIEGAVLAACAAPVPTMAVMHFSRGKLIHTLTRSGDSQPADSQRSWYVLEAAETQIHIIRNPQYMGPAAIAKLSQDLGNVRVYDDVMAGVADVVSGIRRNIGEVGEAFRAPAQHLHALRSGSRVDVSRTPHPVRVPVQDAPARFDTQLPARDRVLTKTASQVLGRYQSPRASLPTIADPNRLSSQPVTFQATKQRKFAARRQAYKVTSTTGAPRQQRAADDGAPAAISPDVLLEVATHVAASAADQHPVPEPANGDRMSPEASPNAARSWLRVFASNPTLTEFISQSLRPEPPVLVTSTMTITYFYDEPMPVAFESESTTNPVIIAPEHGLWIFVGSAGPVATSVGTTALCYGPWHERQKNMLLRYFQPFEAKDRELYKPSAGELHRWAALQTCVTFNGRVVVTIPYRVRSEDGPGIDPLLAAATHRDGGRLNPELVGWYPATDVYGAGAAKVIRAGTSLQAPSGRPQSHVPRPPSRSHVCYNESDVVASACSWYERLSREPDQTAALAFAGPKAYALASGQACGWLRLEIDGPIYVTITSPQPVLSDLGTITHTQVLAVGMCRLQVAGSIEQPAILETSGLRLDTRTHYPRAWNASTSSSTLLDLWDPTIRASYATSELFADLGADWSAASAVLPRDIPWYSPLQRQLLESAEYFVPYRSHSTIRAVDAHLVMSANEYNVVDIPWNPNYNVLVNIAVPFVSVEISADYTRFGAPRAPITLDVQLSATRSSIFGTFTQPVASAASFGDITDVSVLPFGVSEDVALPGLPRRVWELGYLYNHSAAYAVRISSYAAAPIEAAQAHIACDVSFPPSHLWAKVASILQEERAAASPLRVHLFKSTRFSVRGVVDMPQASRIPQEALVQYMSDECNAWDTQITHDRQPPHTLEGCSGSVEDHLQVVLPHAAKMLAQESEHTQSMQLDVDWEGIDAKLDPACISSLYTWYDNHIGACSLPVTSQEHLRDGLRNSRSTRHARPFICYKRTGASEMRTMGDQYGQRGLASEAAQGFAGSLLPCDSDTFVLSPRLSPWPGMRTTLSFQMRNLQLKLPQKNRLLADVAPLHEFGGPSVRCADASRARLPGSLPEVVFPGPKETAQDWHTFRCETFRVDMQSSRYKLDLSMSTSAVYAVITASRSAWHIPDPFGVADPATARAISCLIPKDVYPQASLVAGHVPASKVELHDVPEWHPSTGVPQGLSPSSAEQPGMACELVTSFRMNVVASYAPLGVFQDMLNGDLHNNLCTGLKRGDAMQSLRAAPRAPSAYLGPLVCFSSKYDVDVGCVRMKVSSQQLASLIGSLDGWRQLLEMMANEPTGPIATMGADMSITRHREPVGTLNVRLQRLQLSPSLMLARGETRLHIHPLLRSGFALYGTQTSAERMYEQRGIMQTSIRQVHGNDLVTLPRRTQVSATDAAQLIIRPAVIPFLNVEQRAAYSQKLPLEAGTLEKEKATALDLFGPVGFDGVTVETPSGANVSLSQLVAKEGISGGQIAAAGILPQHLDSFVYPGINTDNSRLAMKAEASAPTIPEALLRSVSTPLPIHPLQNVEPGQVLAADSTALGVFVIAWQAGQWFRSSVCRVRGSTSQWMPVDVCSWETFATATPGLRGASLSDLSRQLPKGLAPPIAAGMHASDRIEWEIDGGGSSVRLPVYVPGEPLTFAVYECRRIWKYLPAPPDSCTRDAGSGEYVYQSHPATIECHVVPTLIAVQTLPTVGTADDEMIGIETAGSVNWAMPAVSEQLPTRDRTSAGGSSCGPAQAVVIAGKFDGVPISIKIDVETDELLRDPNDIALQGVHRILYTTPGDEPPPTRCLRMYAPYTNLMDGHLAIDPVCKLFYQIQYRGLVSNASKEPTGKQEISAIISRMPTACDVLEEAAASFAGAFGRAEVGVHVTRLQFQIWSQLATASVLEISAGAIRYSTSTACEGDHACESRLSAPSVTASLFAAAGTGPMCARLAACKGINQRPTSFNIFEDHISENSGDSVVIHDEDIDSDDSNDQQAATDAPPSTTWIRALHVQSSLSLHQTSSKTPLSAEPDKSAPWMMQMHAAIQSIFMERCFQLLNRRQVIKSMLNRQHVVISRILSAVPPVRTPVRAAGGKVRNRELKRRLHEMGFAHLQRAFASDREERTRMAQNPDDLSDVDDTASFLSAVSSLDAGNIPSSTVPGNSAKLQAGQCSPTDWTVDTWSPLTLRHSELVRIKNADTGAANSPVDILKIPIRFGGHSEFTEEVILEPSRHARALHDLPWCEDEVEFRAQSLSQLPQSQAQLREVQFLPELPLAVNSQSSEFFVDVWNCQLPTPLSVWFSPPALVLIDDMYMDVSTWLMHMTDIKLEVFKQDREMKSAHANARSEFTRDGQLGVSQAHIYSTRSRSYSEEADFVAPPELFSHVLSSVRAAQDLAITSCAPLVRCKPPSLLFPDGLLEGTYISFASASTSVSYMNMLRSRDLSVSAVANGVITLDSFRGTYQTRGVHTTSEIKGDMVRLTLDISRSEKEPSVGEMLSIEARGIELKRCTSTTEQHQSIVLQALRTVAPETHLSPLIAIGSFLQDACSHLAGSMQLQDARQTSMRTLAGQLTQLVASNFAYRAGADMHDGWSGKSKPKLMVRDGVLRGKTRSSGMPSLPAFPLTPSAPEEHGLQSPRSEFVPLSDNIMHTHIVTMLPPVPSSCSTLHRLHVLYRLMLADRQGFIMPFCMCSSTPVQVVGVKRPDMKVDVCVASVTSLEFKVTTCSLRGLQRAALGHANGVPFVQCAVRDLHVVNRSTREKRGVFNDYPITSLSSNSIISAGNVDTFVAPTICHILDSILVASSSKLAKMHTSGTVMDPSPFGTIVSSQSSVAVQIDLAAIRIITEAAGEVRNAACLVSSFRDISFTGHSTTGDAASAIAVSLLEAYRNDIAAERELSGESVTINTLHAFLDLHRKHIRERDEKQPIPSEYCFTADELQLRRTSEEESMAGLGNMIAGKLPAGISGVSKRTFSARQSLPRLRPAAPEKLPAVARRNGVLFIEHDLGAQQLPLRSTMQTASIKGCHIVLLLQIEPNQQPPRATSVPISHSGASQTPDRPSPVMSVKPKAVPFRTPISVKSDTSMSYTSTVVDITHAPSENMHFSPWSISNDGTDVISQPFTLPVMPVIDWEDVPQLASFVHCSQGLQVLLTAAGIHYRQLACHGDGQQQVQLRPFEYVDASYEVVSPHLRVPLHTIRVHEVLACSAPWVAEVGALSRSYAPGQVETATNIIACTRKMAAKVTDMNVTLTPLPSIDVSYYMEKAAVQMLHRAGSGALLPPRCVAQLGSHGVQLYKLRPAPMPGSVRQSASLGVDSFGKNGLPNAFLVAERLSVLMPTRAAETSQWVARLQTLPHMKVGQHAMVDAAYIGVLSDMYGCFSVNRTKLFDQVLPKVWSYYAESQAEGCSPKHVVRLLVDKMQNVVTPSIFGHALAVQHRVMGELHQFASSIEAELDAWQNTRHSAVMDTLNSVRATLSTQKLRPREDTAATAAVLPVVFGWDVILAQRGISLQIKSTWLGGTHGATIAVAAGQTFCRLHADDMRSANSLQWQAKVTNISFQLHAAGATKKKLDGDRRFDADMASSHSLMMGRGRQPGHRNRAHSTATSMSGDSGPRAGRATLASNMSTRTEMEEANFDMSVAGCISEPPMKDSDIDLLLPVPWGALSYSGLVDTFAREKPLLSAYRKQTVQSEALRFAHRRAMGGVRIRPSSASSVHYLNVAAPESTIVSITTSITLSNSISSEQGTSSDVGSAADVHKINVVIAGTNLLLLPAALATVQLLAAQYSAASRTFLRVAQSAMRAARKKRLSVDPSKKSRSAAQPATLRDPNSLWRKLNPVLSSQLEGAKLRLLSAASTATSWWVVLSLRNTSIITPFHQHRCSSAPPTFSMSSSVRAGDKSAGTEGSADIEMPLASGIVLIESIALEAKVDRVTSSFLHTESVQEILSGMRTPPPAHSRRATMIMRESNVSVHARTSTVVNHAELELVADDSASKHDAQDSTDRLVEVVLREMHGNITCQISRADLAIASTAETVKAICGTEALLLAASRSNVMRLAGLRASVQLSNEQRTQAAQSADKDHFVPVTVNLVLEAAAPKAKVDDTILSHLAGLVATWANAQRLLETTAMSTVYHYRPPNKLASPESGMLYPNYRPGSTSETASSISEGDAESAPTPLQPARPTPQSSDLSQQEPDSMAFQSPLSHAFDNELPSSYADDNFDDADSSYSFDVEGTGADGMIGLGAASAQQPDGQRTVLVVTARLHMQAGQCDFGASQDVPGQAGAPASVLFALPIPKVECDFVYSSHPHYLSRLVNGAESKVHETDINAGQIQIYLADVHVSPLALVFVESLVTDIGDLQALVRAEGLLRMQEALQFALPILSKPPKFFWRSTTEATPTQLHGVLSPRSARSEAVDAPSSSLLALPAFMLVATVHPAAVHATAEPISKNCSISFVNADVRPIELCISYGRTRRFLGAHQFAGMAPENASPPPHIRGNSPEGIDASWQAICITAHVPAFEIVIRATEDASPASHDTKSRMESARGRRSHSSLQSPPRYAAETFASSRLVNTLLPTGPSKRFPPSKQLLCMQLPSLQLQATVCIGMVPEGKIPVISLWSHAESFALHLNSANLEAGLGFFLAWKYMVEEARQLLQHVIVSSDTKVGLSDSVEESGRNEGDASIDGTNLKQTDLEDAAANTTRDAGRWLLIRSSLGSIKITADLQGRNASRVAFLAESIRFHTTDLGPCYPSIQPRETNVSHSLAVGRCTADFAGSLEGTVMCEQLSAQGVANFVVLKQLGWPYKLSTDPALQQWSAEFTWLEAHLETSDGDRLVTLGVERAGLKFGQVLQQQQGPPEADSLSDSSAANGEKFDLEGEVSNPLSISDKPRQFLVLHVQELRGDVTAETAPFFLEFGSDLLTDAAADYLQAQSHVAREGAARSRPSRAAAPSLPAFTVATKGSNNAFPADEWDDFAFQESLQPADGRVPVGASSRHTDAGLVLGTLHLPELDVSEVARMGWGQVIMSVGKMSLQLHPHANSDRDVVTVGLEQFRMALTQEPRCNSRLARERSSKFVATQSADHPRICWDLAEVDRRVEMQVERAFVHRNAGGSPLDSASRNLRRIPRPSHGRSLAAASVPTKILAFPKSSVIMHATQAIIETAHVKDDPLSRPWARDADAESVGSRTTNRSFAGPAGTLQRVRYKLDLHKDVWYIFIADFNGSIQTTTNIKEYSVITGGRGISTVYSTRLREALARAADNYADLQRVMNADTDAPRESVGSTRPVQAVASMASQHTRRLRFCKDKGYAAELGYKDALVLDPHLAALGDISLTNITWLLRVLNVESLDSVPEYVYSMAMQPLADVLASTHYSIQILRKSLFVNDAFYPPPDSVVAVPSAHQPGTVIYEYRPAGNDDPPQPSIAGSLSSKYSVGDRDDSPDAEEEGFVSPSEEDEFFSASEGEDSMISATSP